MSEVSSPIILKVRPSSTLHFSLCEQIKSRFGAVLEKVHQVTDDGRFSFLFFLKRLRSIY